MPCQSAVMFWGADVVPLFPGTCGDCENRTASVLGRTSPLSWAGKIPNAYSPAVLVHLLAEPVGHTRFHATDLASALSTVGIELVREVPELDSSDAALGWGAGCMQLLFLMASQGAATDIFH